MKNLFFKDVSRSFILKVIGLGLSFLIQIIISRYLGIESYGVWNKAFSWMQIILIIALFGNQKTLLREASADKSFSINRYWSISLQAIIAFTGIYVLFIIIGQTVNYISGFEFEFALLITFILGINTVLNMLSTAMLQAKQKNYITILVNIVCVPLVNAIFLICISYIYGDDIRMLLSYIISGVLGVILLINIVGKKYPKEKFNFERKININYSFWINDLSKNILPYLVIAFISFLLSDQELGGYSASFKITRLMLFFSSVFISFSPIIVRYVKDNRLNELEKAYLTINKLLLVIVYPVLLGLFMFSEYILLIFGKQFQDFNYVLQILSIAAYVITVTGPIGEMLNMSGNERIEKNINVVTAFCNIALLFPLSNTYGVAGAALSFTIPAVASNISKLYYVKKVLNIKTFKKKHLTILLIQIILTLINIYLMEENYSIYLFTISLIVYAASIYLLRLANITELKLLYNTN